MGRESRFIRLSIHKGPFGIVMSINIPKTFYGARCAICVALVLGALFGNADDVLRRWAVGLAVSVFLIIAIIYAWDRDKYYEDIRYRL
jgi:hypothetical protein